MNLKHLRELAQAEHELYPDCDYCHVRAAEVLKLLDLIDEMKGTLEQFDCECEISTPVNDYPRDIICIRCLALAKIREVEE